MPKLFRTIYAILFLCPLTSSATLGVGDIAVIGFNGDGALNIRSFSVIALATINSGEVIFFTDKGISGGTFNNNFTSEGTFSVTTTSTVAAGTIIMFTITAGVTPNVISTPSIGTITVSNPSTSWATDVGSAPWTGGDQMLIYQSGPTFIFGFNSGTVGTASNGWSGGTGTQAGFSNIPPGLTNGVNAVGFRGLSQFRDNLYYSGTLSGDKATLLAAISNVANWLGNNDTELDLSPTGVIFSPGVLPVHLLSFTGNNTTSGQQLVWKVENEEKFSHYEIESSADAFSFKSIGRVNATFNQQYSFINTATDLPRIYYRLKMVNIDGSYTYSKVIMLLENDDPQLISIYPNPASSLLTISSRKMIKDITLIDAAGLRALHVFVNSYTQSLDITKLAQGIYQVFITTSEGCIIERITKSS